MTSQSSAFLIEHSSRLSEPSNPRSLRTTSIFALANTQPTVENMTSFHPSLTLVPQTCSTLLSQKETYRSALPTLSLTLDAYIVQKTYSFDIYAIGSTYHHYL